MNSKECRDSWLLKVLRIRSSRMFSPEQNIYITPSKAQWTYRKRRQEECKSQKTERRAMTRFHLSWQGHCNHDLAAAVVACTDPGWKSAPCRGAHGEAPLQPAELSATDGFLERSSKMSSVATRWWVQWTVPNTDSACSTQWGKKWHWCGKWICWRCCQEWEGKSEWWK